MSGLPPVPVPKQERDRDSGLRWPFLLIGLVVGAGIITGGVLVFRGWRWGRSVPTTSVRASPFRPDVAVKINSWKLVSRVPGNVSLPRDAARGSLLLANVTATNNGSERLGVLPEMIGIETTDHTIDYGDTQAFITPLFEDTVKRYGRPLLAINGMLAPGQSATGDVIILTTDQASPLRAGYKP